MHPLDILSDSPNLYILQKKSNKTNFGGILFFIYLILIMLVLTTYIIDYIQNDKYIIESFNHFNIKTEEEKRERSEMELFNPYINFSLYLKIELNKTIYNFNPNNIKLYDNKAELNISQNSVFLKRISDFQVIIFYECIEENCSDYSQFLNNLKRMNNNQTVDNCYLYLEYYGFTLNHQNSTKPVLKTEDNGMIFERRYKLNIKRTSEILNQWRGLLYTERNGFLQKETNYNCGYIENYNIFTYNALRKIRLTERKNKQLLELCEIEFVTDYTEYTQYFRKKVSLLDLAAKILNLIANIFAGIKIIMRIYSSNFNNYKIIEKLLNKSEKTSQTKNKLKEKFEMYDFETKNKFIPIKNEQDNAGIINDDTEDNENDIDENEDNYDDAKGTYHKYNGNSRRLKKLNLCDFFLNYFCLCCLKKQKNQKIIFGCNQIVYNYASLDNIIKNQILMENLIKDYKWNNPGLNNVENNSLFILLKTYL